MKKRVLFFTVGVVAYCMSCFLPWHVRRNQFNKDPIGIFIYQGNQRYLDGGGLTWRLVPPSGSVYHQTPLESELRHYYSNFEVPPIFNPESPNLKMLSKTNNGASFEAVVLPNGTLLLAGAQQATYNYSDPSGLLGNIGHLFLDLIPHWINSNYE